VRKIWETLHEEGKITYSYTSFCLHVNKIIRKKDASASASRSRHHTDKSKQETLTANVDKPSEDKTIVEATKVIPGTQTFNFSSKPLTKEELYGE
jgi:hypothetical protein